MQINYNLDDYLNQEPLNEGCQILCNLSGGVDSAYGTFLTLQNYDKVLIHHCKLDFNYRVEWEQTATENILDWYKEQGFGNFDYIESYVCMPQHTYSRRTRDPELIMFLSGSILRSRPHIKLLAYFNNKHDTSTVSPRGRETLARIQTMYLTARRKDIRILRPLEKLTKQEIISEMPKELFDLCSYCRFPDENGEPCNECHTCKTII